MEGGAAADVAGSGSKSRLGARQLSGGLEGLLAAGKRLGGSSSDEDGGGSTSPVDSGQVRAHAAVAVPRATWSARTDARSRH